MSKLLYPTVLDFLKDTFDSDQIYIVRPWVKCKDGFFVSIQGGTSLHYCLPRRHINEYTHLELGYPSAPEELIMPYKDGGRSGDPTNSVYAQVPLEVVEELIKRHGGIVAFR